MLLTRTFILFHLFQFTQLISAQELLTPGQAVNIALENNFSIRMARNQVEISSNNLTYGNAGFLPAIDLSAAQNNNIQNSRQEYFSGQINERENARSNSHNWSVTLNWTLFDGLAMFLNYDKLREFEAMGELAAHAVIERTIVEVLSAYYDLVRQKQHLQVIDKSISISEERIRLAEEKFGLGAASRLDILQAQVDYNADRSELLNNQENFRISKIRLNNMLARKIDQEFEVEATIDTVAIPEWSLLYADAMSGNTYLRMSQSDNRIAALELRQVNASRSPRLNAILGYNYLKSESESGFTKSNRTSGLNYGLSVGWNLFDGFNLNRQISNARITLENAEIELNDSRSRLEADLMATFISLQSKIQLVDFEQHNLEVANRNLAIAMERFRLGELSGFELREAQKNYLAVESRLITARYQAKIVEVGLKEISGSIMNRVR